MVSDVSSEMQSDSKNYVGLQDDEITEPVHTIKLACASTGGPERNVSLQCTRQDKTRFILLSSVLQDT